jgi:hypothetical protein
MAKGRKTGGRKAGTPNKVTTELGEACRQLVENHEYRTYFEHRLKVGQLPPALEAMVWHYAYGKPLERQELSAAKGGLGLFTWLPPTPS